MAFFYEETFGPAEAKLFPELAELLSETRKASGASIWALSPAFSVFFQTDFVSNFLEWQLRKVNEERDYAELVQDIGIEIIQLSEYTLSIGKLNNTTSTDLQRSDLTVLPHDFISYGLGPGTVTYETYQVFSSSPVEIFDRARLPQLSSSGVQRRGDEIRLRAGRDLLKLIDVEGDTYQIYVASPPVTSLAKHYDYSTLLPKYCTAAKGVSSSIQRALEVLVQLGSESAVPAMAAAFESPDHFVRWSSVRAVLALDETRGRHLLERARLDPHPHVRAAANKAMAMLPQLPKI